MSPPAVDSQDDPSSGVVALLPELIALRQHALAPPSLLSSWRSPQGTDSPLFGKRSHGMEYVDSRPYLPGDDFRSIDWRQTARRGHFYTKLFAEENERPVHFLVDLSASMRFATRTAFKSVVAARAAAWLAWQLAGVGDRVGGQAWTGTSRPLLRPRRSQHGVLPLLQQLVDASQEVPPEAGIGLAQPLQRLAAYGDLAALVVISDFFRLDAEICKLLRVCAGKAQVSLIQVHDRFEIDPPAGVFRLHNGHDVRPVDLRSAPARERFVQAFHQRNRLLCQLASTTGSAYLRLATDADLPRILQPLLGKPARAGAWH